MVAPRFAVQMTGSPIHCGYPAGSIAQTIDACGPGAADLHEGHGHRSSGVRTARIDRETKILDPAVARLHRFAAEFFLAILRRPLLYGMVIGDVQIWGKLVGSEAGYDGGRHNAMMASYMDVLAARGLVRADLATPELTYAFQSVFEGFIYAERAVASTGTHGERARLLSATVESAFSRPGTPNAVLADEVAALLSGLV
ncbi:hypothetical protein ACTMSW_26270 [Micromonospora sp. BQ11]|uniref:hypothetical protein n=1 Tax=Micromonospora sp. BQ11 TaxID=3452212 RepID=UPI003F88FD3B